jgi:uncharacterized alpha-E superfamily protein
MRVRLCRWNSNELGRSELAPTSWSTVLSRIAESLFWIGRYVERADDTARLLDAFLRRVLEDPWTDEDAECRSLLAILGVPAPPDDVQNANEIMRKLAFDDKTPSAIAGAVSAARENARGARETISSEMWECLNVTWRTLPERRRAAARLGPNTYLDYVRERTAMFSGLAESTLSHDDGWHFLVLGRSLERADMTARLLSVQLLTADQPVTWATVLSACGGYEAFLHTHGGMVDRGRAVQFLTLDRSFPRSVLHSLSTAETCLAALSPEPARGVVSDPARRVIGQVRTTLEYADLTALIRDLSDHLMPVQEACAAASQAVSRRFFTYATPLAWAHEEV